MIENVEEFTVGRLDRQLISGDLEKKRPVPVVVAAADGSADTVLHIGTGSIEVFRYGRVKSTADAEQVVFVFQAEQKSVDKEVKTTVGGVDSKCQKQFANTSGHSNAPFFFSITFQNIIWKNMEDKN